MKKKLLSLLVLVFSIVALAACGEVLVGEKGAKGDTGAAGKSAYDIAVENGFQGTVDQWLESLMGDRGPSGINGAKGSDGIDGKDAHEIKFFEEDGAMCWSYVPNEGEDPELDMFQPQVLYYTKDFITVSYYDGEKFLASEEVARKKVGSYSLMEIKDNDEMIGMGYHLNGWLDKDGEEVEKIENHSISLYADKEYVGVTINVQYGLDKNGQQYATYDLEVFADYITGLFLADVATAYGSEVAKGDFYSTFNKSNTATAQQFMGVDGETPCGLCAAHPELVTKWGKLFEFACGKADSYRDTALKAHGLTPYGSEFKSFDAGTNDNKYVNRYFIGALASFMNHNQQNVDSSSHAPVDFSKAVNYKGLDEAMPELLAEFCAVPGNCTKTLFENVNSLALTLLEGAVFYEQGDASMTPVDFYDLVAGKTYCYGVLPQ